MAFTSAWFVILAAGLILLAGCGGDAAHTVTPFPTPSPASTATTLPSAVPASTPLIPLATATSPISLEELPAQGEYSEGTFLLGKQLKGERIFFNSGGVEISPDGRSYWNIIFSRQDERTVAREFINGIEIRSYTISPGTPMDPHRPDVIVGFESQQAGYILLSNKRGLYVITNGIEKGPYWAIGKFSFTTQNKIAYVAKQNDTSYLIVDGKQVGPEGIDNFEYSPDGEQLAYVVLDSDKNYHMFLDDKEIGVYGHVEELTFDSDGGKLAFIAREANNTQPGERFVVVNGEIQKSYKFIRYLTFSPDGSRLVYSASDGPGVNPEKPVLNGKEGQNYIWIVSGDGPPYVFSPDNSKLAYSARSKYGTQVVLNDRVVEAYGGEEGNGADIRYYISNMTFSPDSKHFAYVISQSADKMILGIFDYHESHQFIVVDGHKREVPYDTVSNLAFTSDGKFIRYNGMKGNEIYLVVEKY